MIDGITQPIVDYGRVTEFLIREAKLLDDWHLEQWMKILSPDYHYQLTCRDFLLIEDKRPAGAGDTCLSEETYGSLGTRIRQLASPAYTVAENPRSRIRRYVTNVLIEEIEESEDVRVSSNCLVYRTRGSQTVPDLFSISRTDTLRDTDAGLRLVKRDAVLDEGTVAAHNLTGIL
jgi:3-phenylpropionate/cinnamic acid dioxygenase small subunit